jgi:hypothetical protein
MRLIFQSPRLYNVKSASKACKKLACPSARALIAKNRGIAHPKHAALAFLAMALHTRNGL